MKGLAYNVDGRWWVKYLVTDKLLSTSHWGKAEVHPDSINDIPTSTQLGNLIEVEFTLHHEKPKMKHTDPHPQEFFAILKKEISQNPLAWEYRVMEPDGRIISVDEYMKSEHYNSKLREKINAFLTDEKEQELINLFKNKSKLEQPEVEKEETPVLVGTLTKPFGINGYSRAEIGHPVFEFKDRYIITIFNNKNEPHVVTFYKFSLESNIKKYERFPKT